MSKNPLGNIRQHKIIRQGKKITVFDVSKRYTDAEGKPAKKFRRCYSFAEAATQLANFQTAIENARTASKPENRLFRELAEFYREQFVKPAVFRDGQKISGFKRNLGTVHADLDLLNRYFGDLRLRSITYDHIRAFSIDYSVTPTARGTLPAVSTINEKLTLLRRVLYIAIQKRWLDANPFRQGDPLIKKSAEKKRNRMMTFEEEDRLLAACQNGKRTYIFARHKNRPKTKYLKYVQREHLIPLIICAVDTAMRRSEIFNLEWQQVDLENRVIYIKEEAGASKTGVAGVLPITDRLYEVFKTLRGQSFPKKADRSSVSKVFVKFDYKRAWRSACEEAGINDLQFRDLRSTGSTRMVLSGSDYTQVMKVTRHRQMKIFVENYTNVDILNARRIGENLSKFIENRGSSSNASSNEEKRGSEKAA